MSQLDIHHELPTDCTTMICAFAGWTNAGESATRAVRYMTRRLQSKHVATIDAEDFFDFTQVRPLVKATEDGTRSIFWPNNDFYVDEQGMDERLLLFYGTEPSLKWRSFISLLLDTAESTGIKQIVTLGASLAATPHSRPQIVSGTSNTPEWDDLLADQGILRRNPSTYQGPTGISTAIREAATDRGIKYISLMGRVPHYLQAPFNPPVTQALIANVSQLLGFEIDLSRLEKRVDDFRQQADKLVREQDDMSQYVAQLEKEYDASNVDLIDPSPIETTDPEALVQELEEFLRGEREEGK